MKSRVYIDMYVYVLMGVEVTGEVEISYEKKSDSNRSCELQKTI